ncbi:MAG: hypothetical protein KatS3mg118_3003 [Paracoccaceae bacterium]|nr:MAG: hypothetical protein KatS3mg118_0777 [Paracoccaceae bacterium]GIX14672.1 MAG: hypothetical protein KatS3mg118_2631 [Paracoccaceae bacterium]GIX15044.1 MAG: hypothetical protein KatS3mg118_3003 [Paracoccaceae bacterium]
MWFDVAAALAEIEGRTPATFATSATRRAEGLPVSRMSRKSQGPGSENGDVITPDLARDLFEERAAIREHDGGLDRAEAEALAVEDVARILGLPVEAVRAAVMTDAPARGAEKSTEYHRRCR